jgi:hypothetical protein
MHEEQDERRGRWQISPARRIALAQDARDEHARCAECKTPAFRSFGDHVALRAWILEHCKPLAAELRDYFRKNPELHPRPDHWFGLLTAQLRAEVALAWERSQLDAVSGIPVAYLAAREERGADIAEPLRAFVVDGFVALACARCRAAIARTPQPPHAVRDRYVTWFFDGDVRAAQAADPLRWQLLDEAIAYCFGELALASESGE